MRPMRPWVQEKCFNVDTDTLDLYIRTGTAVSIRSDEVTGFLQLGVIVFKCVTQLPNNRTVERYGLRVHSASNISYPPPEVYLTAEN